MQRFGHTAGGGTVPSVSIDDHALKLHLEAVLLDRVVETLEPDETMPEWEGDKSISRSSLNALERIPRWLRSWLPAAVALHRSYSGCEFPPSNPRNVSQQSNDTVAILAQGNIYPHYNDYGEYVFQNHFSTEENKDMLDDVLLNIESLNDKLVRERLRSSHAGFKAFMFNLEARETLFATEYGCVGQARHDPRQRSVDQERVSRRLAHKDDVRKGDIVVVPQGTTKPWVLQETDVKGEYKLIIDCYVDGVMSGELTSLVESGKLKTQRYTLV